MGKYRNRKYSIQVLINNLSVYDYEINYAFDGMTALNDIEKTEYDLVILDLMMPIMNGYEVCKSIREKYDYTDLPIIMLTAKNSLENMEKGFDAGVNDYLSKPFNRQELIKRVENLLNLKKSTKENYILKLNIEKEASKRMYAEKMNNKIREFISIFEADIIIKKIIEDFQNEFKNCIVYIFFENNDNFTYYKSNLESQNHSKELLKNSINLKLLSEDGFIIQKSLIERDRAALIFPININKKIKFLIIIEKEDAKIEFENKKDMLSNYILNVEGVLNSVFLYIELNNNYKKLKSIQNIMQVLSREYIAERYIKYIMYLIMLSEYEKYDKIYYTAYYKDTNSLKTTITLDNKVKERINEEFFEKGDILSLIEEIDKDSNINNVHSRLKLEENILIKNSFSKKEILKLENEKIILKNYNSKYMLFFPILNKKEIAGGLFINCINKNNFEKSDEYLEILYKSFEYFYMNKEIRNKQIEFMEKKEFRCKKCNSKLSEYRGYFDYLEIKCQKCNEYNIIKN